MPSNANSAIFPIDLANLFQRRLDRKPRVPFDSTLHLNSDLIGSLRHAQLRIAGAPRNPESLGAVVRMETGTMWHDKVGEWLLAEGIPFMQEVNVRPWLPDGWGGRVDWIFYHPEYQAFVLGDLKTTKGESMWWVHKDGAKLDHLWQMSAYWHALVRMGLPMLKAFGVVYLPMTGSDAAELSVQECDPLPEDEILVRMVERANAVKSYRASLGDLSGDGPSSYITDALAKPIPREQKLVWAKKGHWDVKLVPHWSARFCPYTDDLCGCGSQGETKIGQYELQGEVSTVTYVARKGYEDHVPTVAPATWEINKRRKDADGI